MTRFLGRVAALLPKPAALCVLVATALFAPPESIAGGQPTAPKVGGNQPVYGLLQFKSLRADFDGIDAGQEADPRKYIAGDPDSSQRAVWEFNAFPRALTAAPGDIVQAKLTCSTFHLVKAAPRSVQVVIRVVSHTCPQAPPAAARRGDWQWVREDSIVKGAAVQKQYQEDVAAYRAKKIDPEAEKPDADGWKAANALAEKYGYYEVRLPKVLDGVETTIDLPAGVFRNALKNEPETDARGAAKRPRVSVFAKCETTGVLLGAAGPDLSLVTPPAQKR